MADPGKNIREKFRKKIAEILPSKSGALLVALSGGSDSLALAVLLLDIKDQVQRDIVCFHLDHGLRGVESENDAVYVQSWCGKMGVDLILEKAHDLEKYKTDHGFSTEEAAREYRYDSLIKIAGKINASAILTGHTLDDNIETFILRLGTGAGLKALSGIPEVSIRDGITILRPLLDFKKEELREYLTSKGHAWREDSSNLEADVLRNKVRLKVIPLLSEIFERDIRESIGRTLDNLNRESDLINRITGIDELIGKIWLPFKTPWKKGFVASANLLFSFHEAVRYKIILWALDELGFPVKRRKADIFLMVDDFLKLTGGKRSHHIGEGIYLARSGKAFLVARVISKDSTWSFDPTISKSGEYIRETIKMAEKKSKKIMGPGTYRMGDFEITVETVDRTEKTPVESHLKDETVEYFDPSVLEGGIELVSGAEITGFKGSESPGSKEVNKDFNKMGNRMLVDSWVQWPVLKKDDEVLWIVGVSRRKLYGASNCGKAVRIRASMPSNIKIYL